LQRRVPLDLLRLSDAAETELALTLGLSQDRHLGRIVRGFLSLRGVTEKSCMMLCGGADEALEESSRILKTHGGLGVGKSPGRKWLADRFRHPYLRDSLLDSGYATDTLETAVRWSRIHELYERVRGAFEEPVVVLCHISHPYEDGASLYFTFFFRCPADPEKATARWANLKRAATAAILAGGGTLSHHHGVGTWHAPWYGTEVGADGLRVVAKAASALDPTGILNPHVLLDPTDRLEA
jgi:alkyldihydroxyacetonephosphate synthase